MNEITNLYTPPPPRVLSPPAISVIIPLYNAEKYVGECLDSILQQTFQNFEVIVVDDCSTDSSCEIVKSYIPKFNGRLKLYHTEKNTGSGVVARNIGLTKASGEYVYNMDNDDVITKTALEEMYSLIKEYDADVVYCERYYMSTGIGENFKNNIYPADSRIQEPPFVEEPMLISDNLSERLQEILNKKFWVAPWLKLVRRSLLSKHKIFFPVLKIADDDIWTYELIFSAKKFLRVPNMVYVRRMRGDSLSLSEKTPQQSIKFWLNPILLGLKELDNFMNQIEFFKENTEQRYNLLESFVESKMGIVSSNAYSISSVEIYDAIQEEFGKYLKNYDVPFSAICAYVCKQNKTLKEIRRKLNHANASKPTCPVISVIIPAYNVEKYIGDCLDSLLVQTFQNFEVIVVDDCSTDNSVEIVKSYLKKFGGRLKLSKMEKNSGYAGFPRNKGIELSRGEYLSFLDPDDTIAPNALKEFYSAAKNFNADVVQCEKYYDVPDEFYHDDEYRKKLTPYSWPTIEKIFITKPTLLTNDFEKRVKNFSQRWLTWTCWTQFIRRDFIIENGIRFLNVYSQDMVFTICEICCAKKYLVLPNVFHYWRRRKDSKSQEKLKPAQLIHKYVASMKQGIQYIDNFLSHQDFFTNRPDLKYMLFNTHFVGLFDRLKSIYSQNDAYKFDEFLRKELEDDKDFSFSAFVFSMMNTFYSTKNKKPTKNFPTARVDIKSRSLAGDFQILSVSDDKAKVTKPQWLQKNSIGYMVQSYAGKLEFTAKSTVDGQINLELKGEDVRDPNDKAKRIPYWIDYNKLTVNGEVIFDTPIPAWHDKPYKYTMNVKANEEIKIQIEWSPNKSTVEKPKEIAPAQPAPTEEKPLDAVKKSPAENKREEIAPAQPAPTENKLSNAVKKSSAENKREEIAPAQPAPTEDKLSNAVKKSPAESEKQLPTTSQEQSIETYTPTIQNDSHYSDAVIGVKLMSKGMLKIFSVSDDDAKITRPIWLQRNGIGYVINSCAGKLKFVAKPSVDGKITLTLKGKAVLDPDDSDKHIPYWVDYNLLKINGQTIFNSLKSTWCDRPYKYTLNVKANEEIAVEVEWLPIN